MEILKKLLIVIQKIVKSVEINGIRYTILHIINVHIFRLINDAIISLCASFTKNKPLKNIIIIQSHGDFDCNGEALYNYLLNNNYNEKYTLVWILRHEIPKNLPKNVEAYSLYRPGIMKSLRICLAKYFFADDNIIVKIRDEQISVYCSHGILSLKNISNQVSFINKRLNYCLSPSENIDYINRKAWGLMNNNEVKLIHTGYPCQDVFFKNTENEYNKFIKGSFKKNILWMPTFRKGAGNRNDSTEQFTYGIPLIKTSEIFAYLNSYLKNERVLLIIKLHPSQDPMTYKNLKDLSNIKIVTPKMERELKIDKYNLMKHTDALISDYSSVSFEYMLLNRPIGYVVSDIKNYKIGFIMDNPEDYMAGTLINTFDELKEFIKEVINEEDKYRQKRELLIKYIYKYKDGNSCKRLIDYLKI